MSNPFDTIISGEDCNACLCMVCARNKNNNVRKHSVKKDCNRCNCNYGDKMVTGDSGCFGKGFIAE